MFDLPGLETSGQPMASCIVKMVLQSRWLMRKLPPLNVPTSSWAEVVPVKCAATGAPPGMLTGLLSSRASVTDNAG